MSSRSVAILPLMRGSVIYRMRAHRLAPSIEAASSNSGGMPSNAEAYSNIENAVPRQVFATMIEAIGQDTLRAAGKEGTPEETGYHVGNHPGNDNDSPQDRLKGALPMTHQHG